MKGNFERNVENIGNIFDTAFFESIRKQDARKAEQFLHEQAQYLPTWCRPDKITGSQKLNLEAYFGGSSIVKAHDPQYDRQPRCNVDGKRASERNGSRKIQPQELCFLDVMMSRAFGINKTQHFAIMKVDVSEGRRRDKGFYRTFLRT